MVLQSRCATCIICATQKRTGGACASMFLFPKPSLCHRVCNAIWVLLRGGDFFDWRGLTCSLPPGHCAASRSVDATKSGRIGRLINHSRKTQNLQTKLFVVDGEPRLAFVALRDIEQGTELLYDYGETDPAAMAAHPWLKDC